MKKAFNKKKGFTIVELVIVVAVIGVLTAILVPTFVNLTNKANEASNQAFVKNLNTAMALREGEEGKNKTMSEAVEDAKAIGFDVEKLTPVNGRDLVWDSVSNRFLLLEPNGDVWFGKEYKQATDDVQIWKIYDAMPTTQKFSIYAKTGWEGASATGLTVGFDSGSALINVVEYVGTKDVVLRTKSDQCTITINAEHASVDFYGFAKAINVEAIDVHSLHVYGSVSELAVESGHVEIEDTGIVFDIVQVGAADTGLGATVTNNGYVAETSLSQNTEAARTAAQTAGNVPANVGGDYEIGNLDRFEAFRDTVNAGQSFKDKTIKLTNDISLKDGWTPIGEGSRKAGASFGGKIAGNPAWKISGTAFQGHFNGQGHKISNLNNKGFIPSAARLGEDGSVDMYAYGLFALTASGAWIENVKFENVDIDTSRYDESVAIGDSVGALVGFSAGTLKVDGVEILGGSIIGKKGVAGLVGRAYRQDKVTTNGKIEILNCVNNASIKAAQHASGLMGYTSTLGEKVGTGTSAYYQGTLDVDVKSCTNNGDVYSNNVAAGCFLFGDDTGRTLTITGNTNNGNVNVESAGRAAHIATLINMQDGTGTGLSTTKATIVASGNSHKAEAKVTLKVKTETPDTETADHNVICWDTANVVVGTID